MSHTRTRCRGLACLLGAIFQVSAAMAAGSVEGERPAGLPESGVGRAPDAEIMPTFVYDPQGGLQENGSLRIRTNGGIEQHGWFQRSYPVTGGKWYRFQAVRKTDQVTVPRRSAPVRIAWCDADHRSVMADPPRGREAGPSFAPLAEPEHPADDASDTTGWTCVSGIYHAPTKATQAVIELHLQWAPNGQVDWCNVEWEEVMPPPSRKVRLATVHHVPTGKSPRANCEEFTPLIAEVARQDADLVVLGETIPSVGVGKTPHQVAESIPGPSTQFFGELARNHKLHIVLSLYEREGHAVYNAAVLLGPDGELIGKYRKMCLPHSEIEAGVTPGNDYPVFDTALGKIGMMVCYDGFFPEVARELSNRGAEIIAWPVWGCNQLLARARACENHVYVVSSTYMNVQDEWMISAIFDHAGQPLARADKDSHIAVAEVDLSERYFWRNNLGDFHNMIPRHRPLSDLEQAGTLR